MYSGYYQILCTLGHYHIYDCYDLYYDEDDEWRCPYCSEKMAWENSVNTTNYEYDIFDANGEFFSLYGEYENMSGWIYDVTIDEETGKITIYNSAKEEHVDTTGFTFERVDGYVKLKLLKKAEECTCTCCGNKHSSSYDIYEIPEKKCGEQNEK